MNTVNAVTGSTAAPVSSNSGVKFSSLSTRMEAVGLEFGKFYPYDATTAIPDIDGMRAVKCLYKASTNGGKKSNENSFVCVPTAHITEESILTRFEELAPYLVNYIQSLEDADIKAQHKEHASRIYTEYLSLDKIIEMLEASEQGARLDAAKISAWFDAEMTDSLVLQFATKLGVTGNPNEEQQVKIAQVITAYKKKFESLAGGRTVLKEADCKAMVIAIKMADAESTTLGRRFIARLENMKAKEEEVLLSL